MENSWDTSSATWGTREGEHRAEVNVPKAGALRRKLELHEIPEKTMYRRAYGVEQMIDALNYERLKDGHSYHIMTQAVITLDKGLCEFYKQYYDKIQ